MQKCSFCGKTYEFPRGLTYVTTDGKIIYFCSSKCRKNTLKLKRDKRKVEWVKKAEWNKKPEKIGAAVHSEGKK